MILDIIKQHYPNTKVESAELIDGDILKVSMNGSIRYYKTIGDKTFVLKNNPLEKEHSNKIKAIIREAKINQIIEKK
jgi:hypothetical protein